MTSAADILGLLADYDLGDQTTVGTWEWQKLDAPRHSGRYLSTYIDFLNNDAEHVRAFESVRFVLVSASRKAQDGRPDARIVSLVI